MSHYNEDNFQFYFVRMLERITFCMEEHIGLELDQDKRLYPALLLFNQVEDPLWSDIGSCDGIGFTEKARKTLRIGQDLLVQYENLKAIEPERAEEVYKSAIAEISVLPRPASIFLYEAIDDGPDKLASVISDLIEFYSLWLLEARRWRGNSRAKRLAIRLRAITEFYTDHPVHVGQDPKKPRGAYVECLQALFEVIGLKAHFYRYAQGACNTADSNGELRRSFEALRSF
ncbi:MAG: hypothetical protein AAFX90_11345, partial [Pseudomonadota bacterium]